MGGTIPLAADSAGALYCKSICTEGCFAASPFRTSCTAPKAKAVFWVCFAKRRGRKDSSQRQKSSPIYLQSFGLTIRTPRTTNIGALIPPNAQPSEKTTFYKSLASNSKAQTLNDEFYPHLRSSIKAASLHLLFLASSVSSMRKMSAAPAFLPVSPVNDIASLSVIGRCSRPLEFPTALLGSR